MTEDNLFVYTDMDHTIAARCAVSAVSPGSIHLPQKNACNVAFLTGSLGCGYMYMHETAMIPALLGTTLFSEMLLDNDLLTIVGSLVGRSSPTSCARR